MAYNKNYEVIGYYLNKSGTSVQFDKSYLLEYYYGPSSSNVVNCLQQYQTDKNFENLYNIFTTKSRTIRKHKKRSYRVNK